MSHFSDTPALDADTLATVADLRARACSWEKTAREIGWDTAELRRAVRREPDYARAYREAVREVLDEAAAELVLALRAQVRDPDAATARKATEALAKHVAAENRNSTRLEAERLRAETAQARIAARRADPHDEPAPVPTSQLPPEQVHTPHIEELHARRAADDRAVVWLWGGAHKVGGVAPDPAPDTPLVLFTDDTVPGGRKLFWAARFPLATDPFDGPFPAPPEPTRELGPEHLSQLKELGKGREM